MTNDKLKQDSHNLLMAVKKYSEIMEIEAPDLAEALLRVTLSSYLQTFGPELTINALGRNMELIVNELMEHSGGIH